MVDQVIIKRLMEFIEVPFDWDGVLVDISDVIEMLDQVNEIEEPFPDSFTVRIMQELRGKEWHIGRIKYFVNNPARITPISLDNDCSSGFISGYPIVVDGHHRLMAAIIRNDETIPAYYSGLVDTLDYLTGKIDEISI